VYFDKTYYLAPKGEEYAKVYELLRAALEKENKTGIATFVPPWAHAAPVRPASRSAIPLNRGKASQSCPQAGSISPNIHQKACLLSATVWASGDTSCHRREGERARDKSLGVLPDR
jgi:hypothetical protein